MEVCRRRDLDNFYRAVAEAELEPAPAVRIEPPSEEEIRAAMAQAARTLQRGNPAKLREIYRVLIKKIVVSPKSTRIEGNPGG